MKCSDNELLISMYADNELDDAQTLKLQSHLANCNYCRTIFEQSVDLQAGISKAIKAEIHIPDLVGKVIRAIHPKQKIRYIWQLAAAVILLVAFVSYGFYFSKKPVNTKPVLAAQISIKQPAPKIFALQVKPIIKPNQIIAQVKPVIKHYKSKPKQKVQVAYKPPVFIGKAKVTISYEEVNSIASNSLLVAKSDNAIHKQTQNMVSMVSP